MKNGIDEIISKSRYISIYNLKYSFSKIFIKKMLMLLLEKTYIWFCRSDDVHFKGSFHETNIGHLLTCHQRKIYSYLNVHLSEGRRYSLINYWKVAKCSFCLKYRIFIRSWVCEYRKKTYGSNRNCRPQNKYSIFL